MDNITAICCFCRKHGIQEEEETHVGSKKALEKQLRREHGRNSLRGGIRAVPVQSERNEKADEWVRTDTLLNVDCGTVSICPSLVHPLLVLGISCDTVESDCYL